MSRCKVYQMSDQMRCDLCNLTWDINDTEPPLCQSGSISQEGANVRVLSRGELLEEFPEPHVDEELRGMISGVQDGERVAASSLRRLWSRDAQPRYSEECKLFEHGGHVLYTDADPDAPLCVRDGNGQVVLALCKNCNQGEADLASVCPNPPVEPVTITERGRDLARRTAELLEAAAPTNDALRCYGVGRVADNEQTLSVAFNRVPTDNELRHIHDLLTHNLPSKRR